MYFSQFYIFKFFKFPGHFREKGLIWPFSRESASGRQFPLRAAFWTAARPPDRFVTDPGGGIFKNHSLVFVYWGDSVCLCDFFHYAECFGTLSFCLRNFICLSFLDLQDRISNFFLAFETWHTELTCLRDSLYTTNYITYWRILRKRLVYTTDLSDFDLRPTRTLRQGSWGIAWCFRF